MRVDIDLVLIGAPLLLEAVAFALYELPAHTAAEPKKLLCEVAMYDTLAGAVFLLGITTVLVATVAALWAAWRRRWRPAALRCGLLLAGLGMALHHFSEHAFECLLYGVDLSPLFIGH